MATGIVKWYNPNGNGTVLNYFEKKTSRRT
jgi:cold shock CspA family protein